jgi:hypothetical protein
MTPGAVFFSEPSGVLGLPEQLSYMLVCLGFEGRNVTPAQVTKELVPIYAHFKAT